MNGLSEKRFPALKFIMILYKGVAVFVGIAILIATFIQYGDEGITFLLDGIVTSLLTAAILYASGELICLLLAIEENLDYIAQAQEAIQKNQSTLYLPTEKYQRRSEQLQESMLQALNSLNELERQKIEADKDVQAQ